MDLLLVILVAVVAVAVVTALGQRLGVAGCKSVLNNQVKHA